ncbi:hypothetical protein ACLOAV_009699 [Pseudogymnoascus australis]
MASKAPNLTLFRDRNAPGAYTWSPFVIKLEARLRFSNLPYATKAGTLTDSPKGKLPYVRIEGDDGQSSLLSDTALITKTLIKSGTIADLNADLSPVQAATDLAIRALIEDKLYFLMAHERWVHNFYIMRDQGPLSTIPYLPRLIIGQIVYGKIIRTLHGQGTGRYSPVEIAALKLETWTALDALVAKGWVLGGEGPTDADACLFGFLASALTALANPETRAIVQGLPNLRDYAERVHEEYFSDYKKWD